MKHKRYALLLVTLLLALALASAALAADMNQDTKPPVDGATTTLEDSGTVPDKGAPEIPTLPPIDSPGLEVVTEYAFSQQLGTYTEIAGGTIHGTSTNDDTSFTNIALGFDFVYNGTTYTAISIQSNGFIAMGTSISSSYTPISSGATNNIIAAIGFDIQGNGGTSTLRSEVLGSAPNRVMVVQWKEYKAYGSSGIGDLFNFQIRLYEGSNRVEVVYGEFTKNATARTPQVGLRGASNADFNNRTSTTGWTNTVAGTLNTNTVTLSTTYLPPSGLNFAWAVLDIPNLSTSSKSAPSMVVAGQPITYTISIVNTGTEPATDAVMTDTLPVNTTYVAGSLSCDSGTCWYDAGTNTVYWEGQVGQPGPLKAATAATTVGEPRSTGGQPIELSLSNGVAPDSLATPWQPDGPVQLILDDGSRDNDIGLGGTIEMLWLNRFTPNPGDFPFYLDQVSIWFSSAGLVNVGDDIIIILYENTSGNADPAVGSNFLASFPATIQALDQWNDYTLASPVTFNGPGDVLVGAIALELPGTSYWPASIDQTATQQRSWAGWWNASPPPNPPLLPPENWTLIDAYFPGNWMVRASGQTVVVNEVNITFSAMPGDACGDTIVNTAVINDPALLQPVIVEAGTVMWDTVYVEEPFEGSFPPDGWAVAGYGAVFTNTNPGARSNLTGGTGLFAIADDDIVGSGTATDTELWLPSIDFPSCSELYLSFNTDYYHLSSFADVDYSLDGGGTWNNISHWTASMRGPRLETFNISPFVSGQNAILRFHYNDGNVWAWWWQIDNVKITGCGYEGLFLTPDVQSGSTVVGDVKTYDLKLENCTFQEDTFALQAMDNAWPTWFSAESVVLPHGASADLTVSVEPLCEAEGMDTANLVAVGETFGAEDWAQVNTTVTPGFFADAWQNMATGAEADLYWGGSYYYNGEVCVVGGLAGTGSIIVTGEHHCYNIAAGTWSDKASMPTPLMGAAYGFIDGKFYVAGGFDISFIGYNTLQIYDPATDSWSTGATLPSARGGQAGGVVNGMLYSAGGSGTASFPVDCPTYEYDPVANSWATKASCPLQSGYGFDLGGSVGSSYWGLLFAGGHFNATYGWYAYDPIADSWATLANVPYHKTPLMVEDPNTGMIYSVGGLIGWVGQSDVYVYDYVANTWSNSPPNLITTQGGSLGPAQGSFGDPDVQGIWTLGGTIGSGAIAPAPFELYQYFGGGAAEPALVVTAPDLHAYHLPDMQSSMMMNVANVGTCPLEWELQEQPVTDKLIGQDVTVTVPASQAPDGNIASRSPQVAYPERQFTMHIGSISIEMIDVLIVTPDVVGGGDISLLLTTLAAFPDLNVVVWDGNAGTPSVADMQAYDVVFVGNDILWTSSAIDKIALSNNLADYVDAGGKILVGSFVWSYDDWGFGGGRFITEDYSPFEIATSDIWEPTTLGSFDPNHPVMAGITSVTDNVNHQDQVLSSTGTWVASWADGENFVGVSPNVVGLNQLYFYTADFGGQAGELLHNALLYLAAPPIMDIPWLSEMPTFGVLPSGWSTDVEVTFDSTGLGAGEYYGTLDLFSNDPAVPEYPMPAQLTVMMPEVQLDKTVGLTEATCQDTDIITVVPGTEVVYCYELINTGTYTMTTHDLVDDMLGVLLDDFVYVLAPGESVLITESAVINEYTLNTAYYTATTEAGGFDASAQNAAIVNVINPAIELEKTVGIDPNVCATTDSVQVPAGTDVTYCFKVTNTGDATLAVHDLVDSELGDLLTDFAYDLAPGASVYLTQTATIVADVENTATWTAWFNDVFFAEATDTALVDVIEPAIELVKTVGLDPAVCATTDVITVPVGTEVTYCFTVLNTGDITLTVHDLSDSALGDLFAGFGLDLGPGDSYSFLETVTVNEGVVNTATWTAWVEAEGYFAEATDTAAVNTYVPVTSYLYFLPINYKK